jgi:SagB-type dehydrogenase family enzyme
MKPSQLDKILANRRTIRDFDIRPVPLAMVRRLLLAAQGITDETGKRTAPSAHALHPLSLMLVAGNIEGLDQGLYRVDGDAKTLTLTTGGNLRGDFQRAALEDQPWIGRAAGIITICADFNTATKAFADQPPYGERGTRYVYIEAGAAAQNVQLQCTADGLGCVLVAGFRDEETTHLLGLEAPIGPVLHLCFGWPIAAVKNPHRN